MEEYLVIDESDSYHTYTSLHTDEAAMLSAVQDKDIDYIKVYKIAEEISLMKRPQIIRA